MLKLFPSLYPWVYPWVYFGTISMTLLTLMCWYYRHYIALYLKFPVWFALLDITFVYPLLTGRGTNGVPLMHFVFQKCFDTLKNHLPDGILVVWLDEPYLTVFGEEAMKIFCREPAAIDKPKIYNYYKCIFGSGLIMSNGKEYKKQRKLISPTFYPSMLSDKVPVVNKYSAMLVQQLKQRDGEVINDCEDLLQDYSLRIFLDSSLGFETDGPANESTLKSFKEKLFRIMEFAAYRSFCPWLRPDFVLNFSPYARACMKLSKDVYDFVEKILEDLKKSMDTPKAEIQFTEGDSTHSFKNCKTFGEVLIEQHLKDSSFTMENIKCQVMTAIVGGFDTSSHALNFCLYMLGLHQDVQEKAYNELLSLADGDVQYNDLSKLTYMGCILKETLRLFPPLPMIGRRLEKNVNFGKYKVPKNTSLLIISYLSHRNPEIYPDPEAFDPSRFEDGESGMKAWTFIPFAEGIRSCIGKNFAMMEMKIILTHILRNFRIVSTGSRDDIVLSWELTLKSLKPLRMKFIPR